MDTYLTIFGGEEDPWIPAGVHQASSPDRKRICTSNIVTTHGLGSQHMALGYADSSPKPHGRSLPGSWGTNQTILKDTLDNHLQMRLNATIGCTMLHSLCWFVVVPNILSFNMAMVSRCFTSLYSWPICRAIAHPAFGDPGMNTLNEMACFH